MVPQRRDRPIYGQGLHLTPTSSRRHDLLKAGAEFLVSFSIAGMSLKSYTRRWLDHNVAPFARCARWVRDRLKAIMRRGYRTSHGFIFYGDPGIDVSRSASGELDRFVAALAEVELVVDVGANAGFFTAMAARAGKRVIAIEPHPLNLEALYRCLVENDLAAEVFPIALSERPAIVRLFGGGQGASLLEGWGNMISTYATRVPANTLDNILCGRAPGARLLIKLDVEGAEFSVLQGARATLSRSPAPIWIVEHGLSENFPERNPNYVALFELFWAAGYRATAIQGTQQAVSRADVEAWWTGAATPDGMYYEFRREG
jgi:FkbM family methyltransferase